MRLRAELERRQSGVAALQRQHEALVRQAEELAAEIAAMEGSTNGSVRRAGRVGRLGGGGGGGRTRPKNELSLIDALAKLLKGRTLSVTDAASEVQKAGYRTSSANFRTIVNQTLIKSNKFKKVARGQYTGR